MGMQLRRGIAVHRSRAVMFKLCRCPFAGCFRWQVSADSRLDVSFQFVEGDGYAFLMHHAHPFISAHQSSERYALWCGERRIPTRTVLHRSYFLAVVVHIFPCGFVADELLACDRMLAFGEPLKVLLMHFTLEPPLLGKSPVPLAVYLVALRVIVLAGVRELFGVIRLGLACTQGIRDGQHGSPIRRSALVSGRFGPIDVPGLALLHSE